MELSSLSILYSTAGFIAGGLVGLSFGFIQRSAARRHQKLADAGQYKSVWAAMPGSGKRVAVLLILLALIQFLFPVFFSTGSPWAVSAGVAIGYGTMLYRNFVERRKTGVL